jgi:hypothetical protein
MIVDRELSIVTAHDIPVYAETYRLVGLVREVAMVARGVEPALVRGTWSRVTTLRALVGEALCAADDTTEIRRLREALVAIEVLRRDAWELLERGGLSKGMFDEVMTASARCRREVLAFLAHARHRGWARLCGIRGARRTDYETRAQAVSASSSRAVSEVNSSSSKSRPSRTLSMPRVGE